MYTYRKFLLTVLLFVLLTSCGCAQSIEEKINLIEQEIGAINSNKDSLLRVLEALKLEEVQFDLERYGLPKLNEGERLIKHSAFSLVYDEAHEQAKWVAHIIRPEVLTGRTSRTNDFRPDTLIKTGSAVEKDYFEKTREADGSYNYDGYGFDRGHFAPSADFRWSEKALSESYYYSNMSPQRPEFNRGAWSKLESLLRGYISQNPNSQLYVVTGPVLHKDLKKSERSINDLSIPEHYYKVALDYDKRNVVAFIMPNQKINAPVENFAVTIDSVELLTGIDFFHKLDDNIEDSVENNYDIQVWLSEDAKNDVRVISTFNLPDDAVNTIGARKYINSGKKVTVCGTVVSVHRSKKGHVFINLDKQFPNQIFSATIWKSNMVNFSYAPEKYLLNKKVCLTGKIKEYKGTPSMYLSHERKITLLDKMEIGE